jgi:hypothetical protein
MTAPASRNNGNLWRISFVEVDNFVFCINGETWVCNCSTLQRTIDKYCLIVDEVFICLEISLLGFGVEIGDEQVILPAWIVTPVNGSSCG